MAEELKTNAKLTKEEKYKMLLPQIEALVKDETDLIANMANAAAALKETFNWLWVGFYLNKNEELVLGPFQGPIACTRIAFDKGVCGFAATKKETVIVQNVDKFPGHIACSSLSKSEIVVPSLLNGEIKYVLDIDSELLSNFDETDKYYLEKLVQLLD